MDFMQRGQKPQNDNNENTNISNSTSNNAVNTSARPKMMGGIGEGNKMKIVSVALLFSVTLLAVALIAFLAVSNRNSNNAKAVSESSAITSAGYQAVFLNGGQVYFGKVTTLNGTFMRLSDIYYLRVNQQVQPGGNTQQAANQDVSLAKLGCELHGPEDSMTINRDQIIFWENLKQYDKEGKLDGGSVVKAISDYKAGPDSKKKCNEKTQAAAPQSTTPTATTPAATTPTATTPVTPKKP